MSAALRVHVIGAGMAGLSAALQLTLAGATVQVHEAAPFAGGRCRSYWDRDLGCRIDNGNHLVFSGNVILHDYLALTQALDTISGPGAAIFPFMDLGTGERWTLRLNESAVPWWLFDKKRRLPGVRLRDYAEALRVLRAGANATVASCVRRDTPLYKRFWEPMTVAALNTEPENASAQLLANVLRQSFGVGGRACHPLIPQVGLSETFVLPCLNTLRQRGTVVRFGARLRGLITDHAANGAARIRELDFGEERIALDASDWVILAVPPWVANDVLPGLGAPTLYRSILNAHFRIEAPRNEAGFTGLVGGLAEWVFVRPGLVSVTISAADRYEEADQEVWTNCIWRDVARLFDLDPASVPPCRLVREKRATFAATPAQAATRRRAWIGWENLALAGDWTDTGLPSTIEGALRSGVKAAQVALRWSS